MSLKNVVTQRVASLLSLPTVVGECLRSWYTREEFRSCIKGLGGIVFGLKLQLQSRQGKVDVLEKSFVRTTGASTAELDKLVTAAYNLIGSMVAGIVGGVLAMMGRGKIAAVLMLAGAILPAVWAPKRSYLPAFF